MAHKVFLNAVVAIASAAFLNNAVNADHQWSSYKWDQAPLSIEIFDNTSDHWPIHLGLANTDWDQGTTNAGWTNEDVVAITSTPGTNPACDPISGNIQVCNDDYGDNGWLGIAQIWVTRGKNKFIVAGIAKMNDHYHNQSPYNSDPWRQLVMCQEVAHAFGLGHQDENFGNANLGTCMDYTSNPEGGAGELNNEHPNQHDYDLLEQMYGSGGNSDGGGGEEPKTCNPKSPKCNQGIVLEHPSDWGRLVSGHGPKEVYEKELGNGLQMVTHVTWTIEHAENHEHDRRGH